MDIAAHKSRRRDIALRDAINAIQKYLYNPSDFSSLARCTLKEAVDISQCDDAVLILPDDVFDICEDCQQLGRDYFRSNAICPCTLGATSESLLSSKNTRYFSRLVFDAIKSHSVAELRHDVPEFYRRVFKQKDLVKRLFIIPISHQRDLQAVLLLAYADSDKVKVDSARLALFANASGFVFATASNSYTSPLQLACDNSSFGIDFYEQLLQSSPASVLIIDSDGIIRGYNPAAKLLLGDGVEAGSVYRFIPYYSSLSQWSQQALQEADKQEIQSCVRDEQLVKLCNGHETLMTISMFRCSTANKQYSVIQLLESPFGTTGASEYRSTIQKFDALTHMVPLGILTVDMGWQCNYANNTWYELTGLDAEETRGLGWVNAFHWEELEDTLELIKVSICKGRNVDAELRLCTPLGAVTPVELKARPLFDETGCLMGFLAVFYDISERIQTERKLRRIAEFDSLTDLPNRNLFQLRLSDALKDAALHYEPVAIFFLDLDGFKDVNDSLGHDKGDELLAQVGKRLVTSVNMGDTVARFGGDEFAILFGRNVRLTQLSALAEKICHSFEQSFLLGDETVYVTASIGIATCLTSEPDSTKLLKQADIALYKAKHEGKNQFRYFSDELDRESQRRMETIHKLQQAMDKDEFYVVFQPQASVRDGNIHGFEALLRWSNPSLGLIGPAEFIPLLEECNRIRKVSEWMMEQAIKDFAELRAQGLIDNTVTLSMNISPRQLSDEQLIPKLETLVIRYAVPMSCLVFEITESMLIKRPAHVKAVLSDLRQAGVKIALDDFGTGFSSLSYLQKFPIDEIKIDQSFVRDILTDESDEKITRAIIGLSQSLSIDVVAEGVEDAACLAKLDDMHCNHYQGYFLARPLPMPDIVATGLLSPRVI